MTGSHEARRSVRASSAVVAEVKLGNCNAGQPLSPSTAHDTKERHMGRNVTIGLGTLIIILVAVAILF
jgi:hypothetical protein